MRKIRPLKFKSLIERRPPSEEPMPEKKTKKTKPEKNVAANWTHLFRKS